MKNQNELVEAQLEVNVKILMKVVTGLQPEHVDHLKQMVKDGEKQVAQYETIGYMQDPFNAEDKLEEQKAYLERIRAVLNLVQIVHDTNEAIQKMKVEA